MSTEEWVAYDRLDRMGYVHGRVNHGTGEYVRGTTHTNTIEGFWSHFKCSVKGTHRAISKKHMAKYLGEFEFRFNLRNDSSDQMLDRLLKAFLSSRSAHRQTFRGRQWSCAHWQIA